MDEGEFGVDGGGVDATGLNLFPIERGKGPTVLIVFLAVEEGLEVNAVGVVGNAPDAVEVDRDCKEAEAKAIRAERLL